jgi:glutathione S-transferase
MSQRPVLAYWKIRGLAQPIRLLLTYAGQDFEEKYYECGPAPDFNRDCWLNEKYTLGLDFPNLPYYVDGDIKLTQSGTILKYLARKHGLDAKTEAEHVRLDLTMDEVVDLRSNMVGISYNKDFPTLKPGFVTQAAAKLKEADKYLGSNQWFAGNRITCVDFVWYEVLYTLSTMEPSLLDGCDNLQAFVRRFEALPAIKQYMQSDKYLARPFNSKMALFGSE